MRTLYVLKETSSSISIVDVLWRRVSILLTLPLLLIDFDFFFFERRADRTDLFEFWAAGFVALISRLCTSTFCRSLSIFSFLVVSDFAANNPDINVDLQWKICKLLWRRWLMRGNQIDRCVPLNISKKLFLVHFSIQFSCLKRWSLLWVMF